MQPMINVQPMYFRRRRLTDRGRAMLAEAGRLAASGLLGFLMVGWLLVLSGVLR